MSTHARASRSAGRPRAFDPQAVILAARDVFSERGPELTSIADLEERTGLDRSSLYNTFGSKQVLFDAAMRSYLQEAIEDRLNGLRKSSPGLGAIASFFGDMSRAFRSHPQLGARGCLMVNAVA